MSIGQLTFVDIEGKLTSNFTDKLQTAIKRVQAFVPPNYEPYYLAFSGGKDSQAAYIVAKLSDVPFQAYYNQTRIDPPELVYHIRNNFPEVIWNKPKITMWDGIIEHGMPTRIVRWCCAELKERHGGNRRIITGIRWQESVRRSKRGMVEVCQKDKTKIFVNPIIDWTDKDVWELIHKFKVPYCSLYDEGFKRLGCVLCPMSTARQAQKEYDRWPKLGGAWHRACIKRWELRHNDLEFLSKFDNGEGYWKYWMSRKGEPKINEAQCIMFGN